MDNEMAEKRAIGVDNRPNTCKENQSRFSQKAVVQGDPEENSTNMIGELSPQVNDFNHDVSISTALFESSSLDDLSGILTTGEI
ncbi:hypothetical protein RJT34_15709 [Clitoria ternatea]|uniref:Uncharacterized protein n=1 Tax=Clitoria ternatea TaxID=43366 RepID=A0AAN9J5Y1_CLITE